MRSILHGERYESPLPVRHEERVARPERPSRVRGNAQPLTRLTSFADLSPHAGRVSRSSALPYLAGTTSE